MSAINSREILKSIQPAIARKVSSSPGDSNSEIPVAISTLPGRLGARRVIATGKLVRPQLLNDCQHSVCARRFRIEAESRDRIALMLTPQIQSSKLIH